VADCSFFAYRDFVEGIVKIDNIFIGEKSVERYSERFDTTHGVTPRFQMPSLALPTPWIIFMSIGEFRLVRFHLVVPPLKCSPE
jgi:hypothetical protein